MPCADLGVAAYGAQMSADRRATSGGGRHRARSATAIDDETVREIVRRDSDRHTVTGYDLDVKPAKPAADPGEEGMPLISLNSKMPAGEGLHHSPLDLNQIVSCHEAPFRVTRAHQPPTPCIEPAPRRDTTAPFLPCAP